MEIRGYGEWEQRFPETTKREPTWTFFGYRKSLFLCGLLDEIISLLLTELRYKK